MKKAIILCCLCLMACTNSKLREFAGKTKDEMRTEKGAPSCVVRDNGHEMWTYRKGSCREMIFFGDEETVVDLHELGECIEIGEN